MKQEAKNTDERLPPRPDWQRHALFLDFDGTLTPIVDRPEDVRLTIETRQLLERLIVATGGAIAVVSGRALDSLLHHLGGLPVALSGSHGLECAMPGGDRALIADMQGQAKLDAAFTGLEKLASDQGLLLERKPGAVALHFRSRPEIGQICRDAVSRTASEQGLRALHGDMVSETALRGIDKGHALRRFMQSPPFSDRLPVMIGDDTGDEDAFGAAQDMGGYGLRIGDADTSAQYRALQMDAALAWLAASV